MPPAPESQSKLLQDILQRAATDEEFRRRLLLEPVAAIRDAFGVQVPPGYRIRFIERDPDVDALIVLPDLQGGDELSDDDLDIVAGGGGGGRSMWVL